MSEYPQKITVKLALTGDEYDLLVNAVASYIIDMPADNTMTAANLVEKLGIDADVDAKLDELSETLEDVDDETIG